MNINIEDFMLIHHQRIQWTRGRGQRLCYCVVSLILELREFGFALTSIPPSRCKLIKIEIPAVLYLAALSSLFQEMFAPREKGKAENGSEFTVEYRWTNVLVKKNGRWQCVAAQIARVLPPKPKQ